MLHRLGNPGTIRAQSKIDAEQTCGQPGVELGSIWRRSGGDLGPMQGRPKVLRRDESGVEPTSIQRRCGVHPRIRPISDTRAPFRLLGMVGQARCVGDDDRELPVDMVAEDLEPRSSLGPCRTSAGLEALVRAKVPQ